MSQSPYISMLQDRGLEWHELGEAAFNKARAQHKLVYIHLGRISSFSCKSWIQTLFADAKALALLNTQYICMAVDQEDEPELSIYGLDLLLLTRNHQGSPYNLFFLPDKQPVYGCSLQSMPEFRDSLNRLYKGLHEHKALLYEMGNNLNMRMQSIGTIRHKEPHVQLGPEDLQYFFSQWQKVWSAIRWEPKASPNYPYPLLLLFLFEFRVWQDQENYQYITNFLDDILNEWGNSGFYDAIDGGFFHSAHNAPEFYPDFEKALPDNALFLYLFSLAYQQTQNPLYKRIAESLVSFLDQNLRDEQTGLYTYATGISEERDGANYYTFSLSELQAVLKDMPTEVFDYLQLNTNERPNVPQLPRCRIVWTQALPKEALEALRKRRHQHPGLVKDGRIFFGYNALFLRTLCFASRMLSRPDYLERAEKMMQQLLETFGYKPGHLKRSLYQGELKSEGSLSDYAYGINALLYLYQCTSKTEYYQQAEELYQTVKAEFYNPVSGMFYKCPYKENFLGIKREANMDGMKPSPGSVMAANLLIMYRISGNKAYFDTVAQQIYNIAPQIYASGPLMANWARHIQSFLQLLGEQQGAVAVT
jgi:Highly conserved protein containing a thioredoxin domain